MYDVHSPLSLSFSVDSSSRGTISHSHMSGGTVFCESFPRPKDAASHSGLEGKMRRRGTTNGSCQPTKIGLPSSTTTLQTNLACSTFYKDRYEMFLLKITAKISQKASAARSTFIFALRASVPGAHTLSHSSPFLLGQCQRPNRGSINTLTSKRQ